MARWVVWLGLLAAWLPAQDATRFPPLSAREAAALKQATRLAGEGRRAEAARWLEARLETLDHPALHFQLGTLRAGLGDPRRAVQSFRRVLQTMPDHAPALRNLARSLVALKRWSEAVEPLTRALRHGALPPDLMVALATIHLEHRHDPAAALATYRHALLLEPGDPAVRVGLVVTRLRAGDVDGAVRAAEQALEVFPFHPRLTALLASALIRKKAFGRAADLLEMLRRLGRASARELRTLADLDSLQGLYPEAAAVYAEAEAAGIHDVETRLRHAVALERAGRRPAAAAVLESILEQHPRNGRAWLGLGRIRQAEGKPERALRAFSRAASFLPDHAGPAHLGLGRIHLAEGRSAAAEAAFLEAARDPAAAVEAWKGLGRIAARAGDTELAIRNFRHALTLSPDDPEIHRALDRLEPRR